MGRKDLREEETYENRLQITEGLSRAGGTAFPSSDSRTEVIGTTGEPSNKQRGWETEQAGTLQAGPG